MKNTKGNNGGSLERVVRLLDDCEAALTAASANVMNPDLAIACTQRARQCRQMIAELKQPNAEFRNGGPAASDCNRDAIPPFPATIG